MKLEPELEPEIEPEIKLATFIKKPVKKIDSYSVFTAAPATGILYLIKNFISGHVRLRGKSGGRYPYNYLETINEIFGKEGQTLEVCSGDVSKWKAALTLDIKKGPNVDMIAAALIIGLVLIRIGHGQFDTSNSNNSGRFYKPTEFKIKTKELWSAGNMICKVYS